MGVANNYYNKITLSSTQAAMTFLGKHKQGGSWLLIREQVKLLARKWYTETELQNIQMYSIWLLIGERGLYTHPCWLMTPVSYDWTLIPMSKVVSLDTTTCSTALVYEWNDVGSLTWIRTVWSRSREITEQPKSWLVL